MASQKICDVCGAVIKEPKEDSTPGKLGLGWVAQICKSRTTWWLSLFSRGDGIKWASYDVCRACVQTIVETCKAEREED